jgi:UDP-glucose 4-epimerase
MAAKTRKVVFASSGGTIYGAPESLPVKEGHSQRPLSPYGVAKKVVTDYLHYYREIHGLEYTSLALANVYGPRQDPHGEAGVVSIFSCNIGTGQETSVLELYTKIAQAAGGDADPRYAPARAGELHRSSLDPSRASMHLGWEPWTPLEEGLRRTLNWFRLRDDR